MSGTRHEHRVEWRYLVSSRTVARFLASHPPGWRRHYPRRRVVSIYYDTPELADYRAAVEGVVPRRKLRLRCYPDAPETGWLLECKERLGASLRKTSRPLPSRTGSDELPPEFRVLLAGRRPGLATRFLRSYWICRQVPLRLTADERLEVGRAGRWLPLQPPGLVLLELKFPPELEHWGRRLAAPLGRARSGGKYKAAVERFAQHFLPWEPGRPSLFSGPGALSG